YLCIYACHHVVHRFPTRRSSDLQLLKQELREYEKVTPMTEEEREALHEWVAAGNSVHENGSMASYESGRPVDFLDVYREEEEIRDRKSTRLNSSHVSISYAVFCL